MKRNGMMKKNFQGGKNKSRKCKKKTEKRNEFSRSKKWKYEIYKEKEGKTEMKPGNVEKEIKEKRNKLI